MLILDSAPPLPLWVAPALRATRILAVREARPLDARKPKLLERVREAIRTRHYSRRMEKAYLGWIRRFIYFHDKRHPAEMGEEEITRFLYWLAVEARVSASTQNQALNALLFLYREVLDLDFPALEGVVRAKVPRRLPVVLTREKVQAVLQQLRGTPRLMATLLYGAGLRLLECARLRLKDIDFNSNQIVVRGGKGDKDRITLLPSAVKPDLARHLAAVQQQHRGDLERGAGWVELPDGLSRKYPTAGRKWGWQWVFPATRIYTGSLTRERRRHHLHESVLQRAVKEAAPQGGPDQARELPYLPALLRDTSPRGRLRHRDGPGALGAQRPGHDDGLHHVVNRGWGAVRSPADRLLEP